MPEKIENEQRSVFEAKKIGQADIELINSGDGESDDSKIQDFDDDDDDWLRLEVSIAASRIYVIHLNSINIFDVSDIDNVPPPRVWKNSDITSVAATSNGEFIFT